MQYIGLGCEEIFIKIKATSNARLALSCTVQQTDEWYILMQRKIVTQTKIQKRRKEETELPTTNQFLIIEFFQMLHEISCITKVFKLKKIFLIKTGSSFKLNSPDENFNSQFDFA